MSKSVHVAIDPDVLREKIAKTRKPLLQLSLELGRRRSYLNDCLRLKRINPYSLKLLAKMCGFEAADVIAIPKEAVVVPCDTPERSLEGAEKRLSDIAEALAKIAAMLEEIATQPERPERPKKTLSTVERCCLLLKQMTCYGMCQEVDFLQKCKELQFSREVVDMAIKLAAVTRTDTKGVTWLKREK